jgi:glycosyltransferase involved in cell wall biosynthesis
VIRRLRRAADWRMRAVIGRLDAIAARVEAGAEDTAELRRQVDALHPLLRAVVEEESGNRRRLLALRDTEAHDEPYTTEDPLVSVTIATRDRPGLLCERALPSILAQTHEHLEVVVVGDGAEAEVGAAVAALGDPRVRYANLSQRITAHPDPGRHWLVAGAMARNEATRLARGSWTLHFDDDDHLRPDAIAALLELARGARAEVAYGGFAQQCGDGRVEEHVAFPPREGEFGWQGALVHGGLRFFGRELIAADLGVPGDAYLLRRMLRAGVRFAALQRPVWDYYPSGLRG